MSLEGAYTWKTVIIAAQKESKLLCVPSANLPPNICIPRRVNMYIKRKTTERRETMEQIWDTRDRTRYLIDRQNLKRPDHNGWVKLACTLEWMNVTPIKALPTDLLCDLEDSEKADTTEHGDSEGRHDFRGGQHYLCDTADHHKAIKTVEQWYKVALWGRGETH